MKLEKLTKEQEELMPVVRDEWIKFCLSGDTSVDEKKCVEGINWIYSLAKLKNPTFISFAEGPMAAQLIFSAFPNMLKAIGVKGNSVGNSVENSVGNSVRNSVGNSYERPYSGLGWWSGWFSFYDYFDRLKLGIVHKDFIPFRSLVKTGAWDFLWFEDLCVVTCRPSVVKKDSNGLLHCDNGPAAEWPSGEKYWFLHGINVPEWLVTTDSGKIDSKLALEEKNVDVQREIIRKIGAERMLRDCNAKVLDIFVDRHSKGGNVYKLMEMKIGQIDRKYLYFEHASLPGVFYAQPVPPNSKKSLHARAWILGIGEISDLMKTSDEEIKESLPSEVS